MAQTSLNSTGVASSGALSLQSNGTTEAIGISTGQVATLAQNPILTSGTANGVAYLNGSKVLTTGSALTFDGTNFGAPQSVISNSIATLYGNTFSAGNSQTWLTNNASASDTYRTSDAAQRCRMLTGVGFTWESAASGTAGASISWSEQMRLTSTGLGIGTSSPSQKLQVGDGTAAANWARIYGTVSDLYIGQNTGVSHFGLTNAAKILSIANYPIVMGTANAYDVIFGTNNTERMRLDSSGNLGLGVTPSAWGSTWRALEGSFGQSWFYSNVATSTGLTGNAYNNGTNWIYKTTNAAQRYEIGQGAGEHRWYNAPSGTAGNAISFTQAMTLDASGNLLVGTTSVIQNGKISSSFNGQTSNGIVLQTTFASGGTGFIRFVNSAGTSQGEITANSTTTVSYNTTSDYRLKTVIGPVANAGQRIDALEPVEYTWNSNGSRTRGFLAHQFQEVYEGSVSGTKDAVDANGKPVYQSMQASSSEVIADLVAEIQSLRKRLAAAGI